MYKDNNNTSTNGNISINNNSNSSHTSNNNNKDKRTHDNKSKHITNDSGNDQLNKIKNVKNDTYYNNTGYTDDDEDTIMAYDINGCGYLRNNNEYVREVILKALIEVNAYNRVTGYGPHKRSNLVSLYYKVKETLPITEEIVFIDGSTRHHRGLGYSGYGLFWNNDIHDPRNLCEALTDFNTSSEEAELAALLKCLQIKVGSTRSLRIETDCRNNIENLHYFINDVPDVLRRSHLHEQIIMAIKARRGMISIGYCPAHAGIHGNVVADKLAGRASTACLEMGKKDYHNYIHTY
ncbi:unnamed protein product [Cunninghamella blakesleeana]